FNARLTAPMHAFLQATPLSSYELHSSLRVRYRRLTLINRHTPERVTLDIDLDFSHENRQTHFANMAIFEIKQEKLRGSDMSEILKKHHLRPGSISKYSLGIISTREQIKFNRFKSKFQQIVKLNQSI